VVYAQEGKDANLNKDSFGCSFLLGGWRSNQGWSFPFVRSWTDESWIQCGVSRHQLIQSGRLKSQSRDWACNVVGDCPSKRGRYCILQRIAKSWSVNRSIIERRGKISLLPLKLDENQALVLDKEDVLAHWRCGHEVLATKK
jgi:hypothetical protein